MLCIYIHVFINLIWKWYNHYDIDVDNILHFLLQILKSLLLMPNVYATREFQEAREKTARENIKKEVENLSAQI